MTTLHLNDSPARFFYEYPERARVALVGCGGQAQRNVLPALRFAPADLIAVADVEAERARTVAAAYGIPRTYTDYREMLDTEALDAVFFATGYDAQGNPLYPEQASAALDVGCHAWIEKPPAARVSDIEALHARAQSAGREVGVGFMKIFSPAVRKVCALAQQPDFGRLTTLYLRDPEQLPPRALRGDLTHMRWVLDHVVHPASVLHAIGGPLRRMYLEEEPGGASIVVLRFESGACGVLHQAWGQGSTSPKERLEVVGSGASVRVENNTRVTYYRRRSPGEPATVYGRTSTFLTSDDSAPLTWEMDAYSGQPFNMHVFYQGYAFAIRYFCEQILAGRPVLVGGLADAWHVTRFFECLSHAQEGEVTELAPGPEWTVYRSQEYA